VVVTAGSDRASGRLESTALRRAESWPRLIQLTGRDFRNHALVDLAFDPGTTILYGSTGAGKTNLLEAIHFGCTGKSCWSANDRDLIRFDQRATRVAVTCMSDDLTRTFETSFDSARKKLLKVDGAVVDRVSPDEGRPLLCVFMPDRLELVKGPARVRRERLDSLVATLWPSRKLTKLSYVRALAQRNSLLGRLRSSDAAGDSLTGWDRELARHGFELMSDRFNVVELLAPSFSARAAELGLGGEVTFTYRPRSRAQVADELAAELLESRAADIERGYTGHGPHRDEFRFEMDGRDLRRFGSQGQQRVALLALILAERDALKAARGGTPILLLDDVLSELDGERRARLLDALRIEGQSLITTAEPDAVRMAGKLVSSIRVGSGGSHG
jgi:DNA replication and repair protein RecF